MVAWQPFLSPDNSVSSSSEPRKRKQRWCLHDFSKLPLRSQPALQRVWRAGMLRAPARAYISGYFSLKRKHTTTKTGNLLPYHVTTKSELFNDINSKESYDNRTEIYPYREDKISPNLTCGRLKSGLIHLSARLLPTLRNKYNSD